MSLFSMIFGSSAKAAQSNDSFPDEKFMVVEATLNNKPVVGSFNAAYKEYSLKKKYPWCLKLAIALDEGNLFANGLPKGEESAVANKLEDELVEKIQSLTTAHYLGHLFNDTFLDIYIYLDSPEMVHMYLQTQVNKDGLVRAIAYEITQDPEWLLVAPFIKK